MEIKELHATIMLLSIIFLSSIFKNNEVIIPENTITIIKQGQTPIFQNYNFVEDEERITVDTSRHIIDNANHHAGRKWMKKYRSGIRFEFNP